MKKQILPYHCRSHIKYGFNEGFVCKQFENIFKKGENGGNQHFPLSQQCYQAFCTVGKTWACGNESFI